MNDIEVSMALWMDLIKLDIGILVHEWWLGYHELDKSLDSYDIDRDLDFALWNN